MSKRVLVVEDEETLRVNIARYLDARGYQTDGTATGNEAMALLRRGAYDVLVTDLRLPDVNGATVVDYAQAVAPSTVILVITAYGSLDSALGVFRRGVHDYLLKPFMLEELGEKLESIGRMRDLIRENTVLRQEMHKRHDPQARIIGSSAAITHVIDMVKRIAPFPSTVLISGESGSGKELVARALHEGYKRPAHLFVAMNMAAIPESLVESSLFGHVRGSFTGADRAREGAFRAASGGTLFLDEIGDLPLSLQAKLLRVLETKEVVPLGSDAPVKVDVRLIAATHRDLRQMVRAGSFRADLFFRLNVVNIHVPALRERAEDIPLLAAHFIERYRHELMKPVIGIDNEAMRHLMVYPWPGNVRELANVIERAILLSEHAELRADDLPDDLRRSVQPEPVSDNLRLTTERFEHRHVLSVLRSVGGNRELAAQVLGISLATLYRYLERFRSSRLEPGGDAQPLDADPES